MPGPLAVVVASALNEVHVAEHMHNLYPATTATLFVNPVGDDWSGWGKRLKGIHRTGHPNYTINKTLLCQGALRQSVSEASNS